jgi:CheY-like chemotaxis protein
MSEQSLDLANAKILIVDDVPANIGALREPLEAAGYEVLIATSGEDAMEAVAGLVPDLILLDVMMPGIDGFETCRWLKARETTADVPIIFLTALDEADNVVEGFDAGGADYVVKPFRKEELLVRVRTHLERARLSAALARRNDDLKAANRKLREETRQRKALATKLSMVAERESERWGVDGFVGQSPLLQKILANIKMLEKADSISVLITGESGTGKEWWRGLYTPIRRAGRVPSWR